MLTNYNEIQLYTIHIVHSPSVKDGLQEDGVPPLFFTGYLWMRVCISVMQRDNAPLYDILKLMTAGPIMFVFHRSL